MMSPSVLLNILLTIVYTKSLGLIIGFAERGYFCEIERQMTEHETTLKLSVCNHIQLLSHCFGLRQYS